ncbi:cyclopropane-fatty-acyl-phospholipid synthase family protein [Methylocapsa sp. S129]|uniref:SAM-dependent methyltransferase n=1 Tax=Methylocapsa sp. S129 TaxID=1641869 RepID=UPI00131D2677|nr:cyclopropane-fatty-acyl-phospholipid synthase family protein [Methylocapsa sp. S129]
MNLIASAIGAAERAPLPDAVTRAGVGWLVAQSRRRLAAAPAADETFALEMASRLIAEHPQAANAQHYELPAAFFARALGPNRKYSCCFYEDGAKSLGEAEVSALEATVRRADLRDGQRILELGCGWGSLSLFMAGRYPAARITAVSNSATQRAFIEGEAVRRGLRNLTIVTADMNAFATQDRFDRIVSVEMFEHMSNWRALLARIRSWLAPEGALFIHIFTHRTGSYRFDHADKSDWIAQHFFTGGVMPSQELIRQFPDLFAVEQEWRWSGVNYERTALDWLANFDARRDEIDVILSDVYGAQAWLWRRRWRLFFLATAGLFGDSGGAEWGVSHYRLRPTPDA